MNALATRDAIFSELHRNVLKPLGFLKKGHWSILDEGGMQRTVYLRASRWSSKTSAQFWIDIQVFHRDWFSLVFGPRAFPGPGEGTPSLVSEELNMMFSPPIPTFNIDETTDIAELTKALREGLITYAWPLLQTCGSLESILAYYQSRHSHNDALSAAAVCVLLNRKEKAQNFFKIAKETAPHENALRWIASRESAIWANAALR
jgi:hypothetical protein